MTKQEFIEYCKKNKTVAFGVPVIIGIILLDFLVLKPARLAKKKARMLASQPAAARARTPQANTPAARAGVPGQQTAEKEPLKPPPPLKIPFIPPLDKAIETRFKASAIYPHPVSGRNAFNPVKQAKQDFIPVVVEEETEIVERPDITYHGFFTTGKDKIAILKFADELILSKTGTILRNSPFKLSNVAPEKVTVTDTSELGREFEIALSEQEPTK